MKEYYKIITNNKTTNIIMRLCKSYNIEIHKQLGKVDYLGKTYLYNGVNKLLYTENPYKVFVILHEIGHIFLGDTAKGCVANENQEQYADLMAILLSRIDTNDEYKKFMTLLIDYLNEKYS